MSGVQQVCCEGVFKAGEKEVMEKQLIQKVMECSFCIKGCLMRDCIKQRNENLNQAKPERMQFCISQYQCSKQSGTAYKNNKKVNIFLNTKP